MYVTTLKKIKIKTGDCCGFCDTEIDIILHMFVMCENITSVKKFSLHLHTTTSSIVGFNVTNFFLGETPLNVNMVINLIILCCKENYFKFV